MLNASDAIDFEKLTNSTGNYAENNEVAKCMIFAILVTIIVVLFVIIVTMVVISLLIKRNQTMPILLLNNCLEREKTVLTRPKQFAREII